MIEKIIFNYLKKEIEVPVCIEEPREKLSKYVLIEKTGTSKENYINNATIAIKSYAESKFLAAELNEQVKAAMDNIVILDSIGRSQLNTDYDFTDTTKKQYRYQAIYDVTY